MTPPDPAGGQTHSRGASEDASQARDRHGSLRPPKGHLQQIVSAASPQRRAAPSFICSMKGRLAPAFRSLGKRLGKPLLVIGKARDGWPIVVQLTMQARDYPYGVIVVAETGVPTVIVGAGPAGLATAALPA